MLDDVKKVGDKVALTSLGLGSVYVEGTITAVDNPDKSYVSYQINWDDNLHPGEWFYADELEEVTPGSVQTHLSSN